ncbi:protein TEX261-like [Tubulanus polymorphus]|uniref:protein TEX261-like n=1 Tax=Tubulanus polymorphus TaxID=672921 RepID=UPI003DA23284
MWLMYLLSWVAMLLQIVFITLSIAAGLYYLAELVEEYTSITGRVIKYLIFATIGVYVALLLFEDLPLTLIIGGFVANVAHLFILQTFPYIAFTSPSFIIGTVMLLVNHYFAFSYFSNVWHPFSEVLAFFTVCLWLVPFLFFVSLSANELVLPTLSENLQMRKEDTSDGDDIVSSYFMRKGKKVGLLSFFKFAQENILPQRIKKQY